jgi:hypothetical protein
MLYRKATGMLLQEQDADIASVGVPQKPFSTHDDPVEKPD